MTAVVVDTNVALTANGRAEQAGPDCQLACLNRLASVKRAGRVVLDRTGLILDEYLKQQPHGSPRGAGDAFLVWVNDNQANPAMCELVDITLLEDESRGFAEFPNDPDLGAFDPADRKFVAVVLASRDNPPVLNATDTDWHHFRDALRRNGVEVEFLCPDLMHDVDS